MTTHLVAIAKATFSAGLLRPDPTSVHRDEIAFFQESLDRVVTHCSSGNIQTCTSWLLKNVIPSSTRIGALGKYLVTLSGSFEHGGKSLVAGQGATERPKNSSKRKRLHILYLLNDLLHHTKYHEQTTSAFSNLSGSLQPFLVDLISLAASFGHENNPKHHKRLSDLLDIWASNSYYSGDYINKLRETVDNSSSPDLLNAKSASNGLDLDTPNKTSPRDAPYIMPATHGDPSAPYHELPAGNLMPHIIPNSTVPIRPQAVKPLQFLAGPADESLATAVKNFLNDVDKIYNPNGDSLDGRIDVEIDELGQAVFRDPSTGEVVDGETYYGWSRSFCENMKKRRDGTLGRRSPSQSLSPNRSYSAKRRRRYSDNITGDDRGRSRSPGSSISDSRSRSASYSRSLSRSRSRTTLHRSGRPRSRSRSKSYSPRPLSPPRIPSKHQNALFPPPGTTPHIPLPQMPYPFRGSQQLPPPHPPTVPGPGGMFIPPPPPRPPGYHGAWPPPPPPLPQHSSTTPPFPPPPPPLPMTMSYPGFQPPAGAVAPQYPPNPHPPYLPQSGSYHSPSPHTTQGPGPGHQPYPGGDANESRESGSRGNDASGRKGWGMGGWY
ncbi:hypothetical protein I7I51_07647 [Histoplasma capsulatum]|uniref:CID domain-containing protein n=1 Tax=Ajellomyces capsulatus TaxID=5037 RepID=A0A8A1M0M8_AJECA|nr:predicted protein [Histoplasma mississippiense (nom. inval.)]EDN02647.1 predicted protein [Histoplasma mississippiense (nom. inval.)]QSS58224.1 hypothetical protein I7I51_07647 [Histoplasma capsulatum]